MSNSDSKITRRGFMKTGIASFACLTLNPGELNAALVNLENAGGLTKIVLEKNNVSGVNTLTQAMINKSNSIYIIQYDYTLSANITLPANCVLEFDGGSISGNGEKRNTIIADELYIISKHNYIFRKVKFGGNCVVKTVCKLDWFISRYPKSDNDYSIDNTNEVKDCFASGFKNLSFPRNYIHLTDTILIRSCINIFTEENEGLDNWCMHPTEKSNNKPCIFSKNIVTLFDYRIDSRYENSEYGYNASLYIGGIQCFIKRKFTNIADAKVPVINITPISYLWGVTIDASITITRSYFKNNGHAGWFFNYTGIKIATSNNTQYCSFVKINGNIIGAYYGLYLHGESNKGSSWFSDVIINGNTQCCYGGVFENVEPVNIYGDHQSANLSHNQVEPEGYFKGSSIRLYGYVWDCGQKDATSGFRTAMLPVKLTGGVDRSFIAQPKDTRDQHDYYPSAFTSTMDPLKLYKIPVQNALYRALTPRNDNNWFIYPLEYTVDGVSILNNYANLKNADHLFNDYNISETQPKYRNYRDDCRIENIANKIIKLSFTISNLDMNSAQGEGGLPNYLWWQLNDPDANISIKVTHTVQGKNVKDYAYEGKGSYYSSRLNIVKLPRINTCIVEMTFKTTKNHIVLPTVIVPFYGSRDNICVSSKAVGKPFFEKQERYGVQCFDLTSRVLNIWDGNDWYNALGEKTKVAKYGNFASKPAANDIHIGFQYFNTDTHKTITWDGKKWYNPDGTVASF